LFTNKLPKGRYWARTDFDCSSFCNRTLG